MFFRALLIGAVLVHINSMLCPQNCSGHGSCSRELVCTCNAGYKVVADCSKKSCPCDVAWADKAKDFEVAHSSAECSKNGVCNRNTGQCSCFPGYTGQACQKSVCGNGPDTGSRSCSGHGTCLTTGLAYELYTPSKRYRSPEYLNWDAQHTTLCDCEIGYTGAACNLKICPKGFDPVIPLTGYYTLKLKTTAVSGALSGTLKFSFFQDFFVFPANNSAWTASECQASFQSLHAISAVSCAVGTPDYTGGGASYTVSFQRLSLTPYENNIFSSDGNPPVSAFKCENVNAKAGRRGEVDCTVTIATAAATVVPAYLYCSGRGICNFNTGLCRCFKGFSNSNCNAYDTAPALVPGAPVNEVLALTVTNVSYDTAVLHLHAKYSVLQNNFNWLKVSDSVDTYLTIDAFGNLNITGGLKLGTGGTGGLTVPSVGMTVKSSATVSSGGLTVTGGVTVSTSGLYLIGGLNITGGLTVVDDPMSVYGQLLGVHVNGGVTVHSKGMLISSGGVSKIYGGVTIATGGLNVSQGLSIAAGGLFLNRKGLLSVHSGGLYVASGGLTISSSILATPIYNGSFMLPDGVRILDSGVTLLMADLKVLSGGVFYTGVLGTGVGCKFSVGKGIVTGNLSVLIGGMTVLDGVSVQSFGLSIKGGLKILDHEFQYFTGLAVPGGVTVEDSGLTAPGGMSVLDLGLKVTGGLTVWGGLVLTQADLFVLRNPLTVNGGMSIWNDGLTISGGVSVVSEGVLIATGGLTVGSLGLVINEGFEATDVGLMVTGGISVRNAGLYIATDGLRLHGSSGLGVGGGMTVEDSGVYIPYYGVTVSSGGLNVIGGVTVQSGRGLRVSQGLTVATQGLFLTGGLSVRSSGLRAAEGLTVYDTGVGVAGGLAVSSLGLLVTGGLTAQSVLASSGVTISEGGLLLASGTLSVLSGGLTTTAAIRTNGGVYVTGGVSLTDGLVTMYGMKIKSGGMQVTGSMSVAASGAVVHGGMFVYGSGVIVSGGVRQAALRTVGLNPDYHGVGVTDGVTVLSGGVGAYGGLTVEDSGLYSGTQGMTISSKGLTASTVVAHSSLVTSSVAVTAGGLGIYGALNSSSLVVRAGGLSVVEGVYVSGGLTVAGEGLLVEDDFNLLSGSMHISQGGFTVSTTGMYVTGGVSVSSGGSVVNSGGLALLDGSCMVKGGVTVEGAGLGVTGGMTVPGLSVFGGLSVNVGDMAVSGGVTLTDNGLLIAGGGLTVYGGSYFQSPGPVTFSDRRLKTRIEQLEAPLSKVSRLRGVYFQWVRDEESGLALAMDERRHVGLIAQDVQAVLPEVVHAMSPQGGSGSELGGGLGSKYPYLGVNYAEMVPLLLEAIRELDQRTASLEITAASPSSTEFEGRDLLAAPVPVPVLISAYEAPLNHMHLRNASTSTESCDRGALLRSIEDLSRLLDGVEAAHNQLTLLYTSM